MQLEIPLRQDEIISWVFRAYLRNDTHFFRDGHGTNGSAQFVLKHMEQERDIRNERKK